MYCQGISTKVITRLISRNKSEAYKTHQNNQLITQMYRKQIKTYKSGKLRKPKILEDNDYLKNVRSDGPDAQTA